MMSHTAVEHSHRGCCYSHRVLCVNAGLPGELDSLILSGPSPICPHQEKKRKKTNKPNPPDTSDHVVLYSSIICHKLMW